jgi:PAS domain S-box-containing protein
MTILDAFTMMQRTESSSIMRGEYAPQSIAATGAALISGIALLGWWTDHAALVTYVPGIANMTFNTALCFMLVALVCCLPDKGAQRSASIRLGVGLLVGLLAVLTQLQDIFGLNFSIDNLLFNSHGYGLLSPHPGRMSPLTAIGFLLIGITLSLLSMHHNRPYRLISITHALILLVGVVGLSGIGLNVFVPETYSHLVSISPFSAISFLLLAIANMVTLQQRHHTSRIDLLLHSGVQLMYKLKYPQKFALISIIFIVPIAMLMWNEIKLAEHDVANARLKITGIEHIRLNIGLLKAIPEHRGMVNARFSNSDLFRQTIAQKTEQIDQLLSANFRLDQLHAGQIPIPQEWSEVTSHWAFIKDNPSDQLLQWQLHTEIITLITRHLRNVGDESGLTFDEDPILHNLLAAQLKEMPELLEQIGQLRGQGTGLIIRKNITRDEQLMVAAMISQTDHYLKEMQRLLKNTSKAQGTRHLANLYTTMMDKVHKFIATSEREFIANNDFSIPAEVYIKQETYFQQATAVIAQSYKLYDASLAYVEQQLHQRINDRIITQYSIKFSAMLLAIILLFLFTAFYKSVMNTIRALDRSAESMRSGDVNELAVLPARDELGDVVGSFNTIAEELMRVNTHMRAVVDHAVDGIISIDSEGTVKSFNPASEHIFGYMADEAVGQSITMLMPESSRERHLSGLQHYCETGEGQVLGRLTEVQGLRKNGEEFPMELSINSMFIDDKRMFIGMVRDSSEHRKMELQLRHAQKMEAVGALIGGVAHNFNNLLAGIVGRTYLAQRNVHKQPEKALTHLESIESISTQAADMVKQLLTFSHKDFFHDKKETSLALLIKDAFKTQNWALQKISISP